MLAIPGIIALIIFIYARPQEFFEQLRVVPWLYAFFALASFGALLDLRVKNARLYATPQLPWVLLFFCWASLTVLIRAPSAAFEHILGLAICVALYVSIAHGVQSFRARCSWLPARCSRWCCSSAGVWARIRASRPRAAWSWINRIQAIRRPGSPMDDHVSRHEAATSAMPSREPTIYASTSAYWARRPWAAVAYVIGACCKIPMSSLWPAASACHWRSPSAK